MQGLFSYLVWAGLVFLLTVSAARAEKEKQGRVDGYGDPLPQGAVVRLGTARFRQGEAISSLAFSPDGKLLASGGSWGGFHLWDAATGKEIHWPRSEFDGKIESLAFAPDGKTLVWASLEKDGIQFWNVKTGKRLSRPIQHEKAGAVRFSPDGKTLATIGRYDNTVRLWDTASGRCFGKHPASILSGHTLAFSPDNKLLAVRDANPKDVCLWQVVGGKLVHRLRRHTKDVHDLCFAADGRMLASGSEDGTIRLWETSSGREVRQLKRSRCSVELLAFLADGRTLAFDDWDDKTIRLWDVAGERQVRLLAKHGDSLNCLCPSPDGRVLATAGEGGAVRLWDVATGKERLPREAHQQKVNSAAWSPDGRVIATASHDSTIRLWDAETGKPLRRLDGYEEWVDGVAFSPDGRMLASIGDRNAIRIGETASASKPRLLLGNSQSLKGDPIFASNCKLLAADYFEANIYFWDLDTQRELRQMKTPGKSESMALSPDGKLLATGNADKRIHIWDVATGKEVLRFAERAELMESIAFSPDGRTLASASGSSFDPTVRLWEVATGGERLYLKRESVSIHGLAFLHDGRTLAQAGFGTIYLWDLPSGQVRRKLYGHGGIINRIAPSPDGRKLLSASDDTTVLVWDVPFPSHDRTSRNCEPRSEEMSALWADLASADAARAYRAMNVLLSSPMAAVRFFRPRLRPVDVAPAERLARLIADLDSDQFPQREKSERALQELGDLAAPALERAMKERPTLEARLRIEGLMARLRQVPRAEQLRVIRAIEILEYLGTSESQEILRGLAKGTAASRMTQQAKESLKRLSSRASRLSMRK